MTKFMVQIALPNKQLLALTEAHKVELSTAEGQIAVLPGHMPLITQLISGVVQVFAHNSASHKYFLAGGVAHITPEQVNIVSEFGMVVNQDARAQAEQEMAKYQKLLAENKYDNQPQLQQQIANYQALLDIV